MEYNVKILKFANDRQQIRFYSVPVHISEKLSNYDFKQVEYKEHNQPEFEEKETEDKFHSIMNSRNRTIKNIFNIARANDWDWFCTFTFDTKRVNSTNYDTVMSEISLYMKGLRKKYKDMIYLLIPELHEDKKKYHVHGLISNLPDNCFIFQKVLKGREVYHLYNYRLGWDSHTRVEDNDKIVRYISKYITKALIDNTPYKRRYIYSLNCNKPEEINIRVKNQYELFNPTYPWKRKLISSYYIKELLIPIFIDGKLVYNLPSLSEIRTHCVNETNSFWNEILRIDNPHSYYVDLSYDLWSLKQNLIYKK